MSFRVEFARRAIREIDEQVDWLAERSQAAAERWREGLLAVVKSLEENPERCPEAPEAEWYGPGLRQLIHGKKRSAHRVLFEIRGEVVVILRVRHAARDYLAPEDL